MNLGVGIRTHLPQSWCLMCVYMCVHVLDQDTPAHMWCLFVHVCIHVWDQDTPAHRLVSNECVQVCYLSDICIHVCVGSGPRKAGTCTHLFICAVYKSVPVPTANKSSYLRHGRAYALPARASGFDPSPKTSPSSAWGELWVTECHLEGLVNKGINDPGPNVSGP